MSWRLRSETEARFETAPREWRRWFGQTIQWPRPKVVLVYCDEVGDFVDVERLPSAHRHKMQTNI